MVNIMTQLNSERDESGNGEIADYILVRFCHMIGELAIKELGFLDEDVYRELRRRNYIRNKHNNKKFSGCKSSASSNFKSANNTINTDVDDASSLVSISSLLIKFFK